MLQQGYPYRGVPREPRPHDQHPRGMHNRVKLLIRQFAVQRGVAEGSFQSFAYILDCDLIAEGNPRGDMDIVDTDAFASRAFARGMKDFP